MKTRISLFSILLALIVVVPSCSEDGDNANNENPVINLISPRGNIGIGEDIEVELGFIDNNGLKEVEVRLGNQSLPSGGVYSLSQRGLSGTSDKLEFTVEPPAGLNLAGTNYIYVKCTDIEGNQTILDQDFSIVDQDTPTVNVVWFDDIDVISGTGSEVFVGFEFNDDGGVVKYTVELWKSDSNDNLVTKWNSIERDYSTPVTGLNSASEQIGPQGTGWQQGPYKVVILVEDVAGNVATVILNGLIP